MDRTVILGRLQQLTGSLKPAPGTSADALSTLQRHLAQQLMADPGFTVTGNRLQHEATEAGPTVDLSARFSHLSEVLSAQPGAAAGVAVPAPLVFRRETAFSSSLLGNSVPQWGAGMAPSQIFGPFLDEHGLLIWFDFFFPTRLVQVFLQGSSTPALLIPLWGALTAKTSYRIEAGSAWIASGLIAKSAALNGFYTGVKIKGGSLDLAHAVTISSGTIIIPSNTAANLHLDLDQNSVNPTSVDAGLDAKDAVIKMPETLELKFPSTGGALTPGNASCTVFGCEVDFQFKKAAPVWIPAIGQILIPYSVQSNREATDTFDVASSQSELCPLAGSAKLDVNSGWLLPVAKVDPKQLGQALGTGALCIGLTKGISASWEGLTGADTVLVHPAILAEPGLVTVVDFFASNVYGKQKWVLWRNAGSKHHSEITLTFGPAFPFIFVISALNSEAVFCFCGHKASLDRPVDANGAPFRIESTIALAAVLQNGADFQAMLQDNDLLFDGNPKKAGAFERHSLALRNAFFQVSRPYSLFLFGKLENGNEITKGFAALMFGIHEYLPTLPDPYVASYTAFLHDRAARGFGQLENALAGFVKWPNPSGAPLADAEQPDDPAYVYFRMAPLDQSVVLRTLEAGPQEAQPQFPTHNVAVAQTPRSFQTGVRTFNADLSANARVSMPLTATTAVAQTTLSRSLDSVSAVSPQPTIQASDVASAVASLEANPLLRHIEDKALLVNQTLDAALSNSPPDSFSIASFKGSPGTSLLEVTGRLGGLFGPDLFMLLDVSSNADQMGVSLGNALQVEDDSSGNTRLRTISTPIQGTTIGNEGLQLQVLNMDVVVSAQNLRAFTLPQISWEPIFNIPLPFKYDADDAITTTPGLLVYDNDGIPTRIASESPYQVPIAPLPVTKHFLKEFNDRHVPQPLSSAFTLPFALLAQANFTRKVKGAPEDGCRVHFHRPHFAKVHGGLQIRTQAPAVPPASAATSRPFFAGWTLQWEPEGFSPPFIKWGFFGIPITGSTLGKNVRHIFNKEFQPGGDKPKVPLEQMEISGYGASIFSNWLDGKAAIALVSQATFEVLVGRTAHEIIQVRSILYPYAVHVVRTITLMRSPNGYVFRSDSGWKAESDGFYDFSYDINFDHPPDPPIPDVHVADPYIVLRQPVKGVSNVREIKDNPDAGTFTSSFTLNDPDLPNAVRTLTPAQLVRVFAQFKNKSDPLPVEMQAVSFDADVHFDSVVSGGVKDPVRKDFVVQSRKMLGYVQLSPSSILVPSRVFADLLNFQNGSLGGPVNCIVDIADSKQTMRIGRVDVNPAFDAAGQHVFVPAARGSLILPKDGSWSVVKQNADTGDVKPLEEGQSVPLIKPEGTPDFRIANPADAVVPTSKVNFGIVQSTGTQKLLFNIPHFSPGQLKLKSEETYFADAYKLLNAKSVFPNLANALQLTNAEKEVAILGEGLMQMPNRDINLPTSLPDYDFINEPNIIRVYAQYKNTAGTAGKLTLGIDSGAADLADRWKAALSGMRVVVDLAGITEVMWVDGNFNASSGLDAKYDSPQLQFGDLLKPVVEILKVLALLTGDDFDNGMDVGMSNSPDSWEYKFHCSQDIPVIQFPSPEELTINPNPPLKLEAGLKVGFYFNEVLSIPTDLKQLVPACGAFVDFHGGMHVMCFSLAAASIYAVGQVDLGIAADTKAGKSLHMKFGFGVEVVVGLPVVANVSVLYMVEVTADIGENALDIGAMMMFRGHAEICGGLVGICIQIEAGGSVHHDLGSGETDCVAQVIFSVNVTLLWVIDIHESDQWQETRQIA
ncbi:MAG: hypothetical protein JWQ49_1675 [Edaphobacter sp.]|nr:hypothetical protein [Edaphobacter sp.]